MPDLIINGIVIPQEALGTHSQSYELTGGRSRLRMSDGSQIAQARWSKLATTLRASGWFPGGLVDIDPSTPVSLACVAPRAIASTHTVLTLPAARRSDAAPIAQAVLGGRIVCTDLEVEANMAVVTAVAGATGYRVLYWPLLMAYVEITEETDLNGADFGWTLTAQEA